MDVLIASSLVDLLALRVSALPNIDLHGRSVHVAAFWTASFWTASFWTAATAGHADSENKVTYCEGKYFGGSQLSSVLRVGWLQG